MRTSISVAVLTFLLLFTSSSSFLLEYCNGAFAAFVCVLVKDVTAGATFVNCWSCVWGTILSSILIAIVLALSGESELSTGYILLALFGSVFIMQYFEVPLMGKKLGVSFIPQVLLALNQSNIYRWKTLWSLVISVMFGCICGLIGVFIPPPARLAGYEVSGRLSYCTQTMSSLLQSVLQGWIQQPIHYQEVESSLLRNNDHIHAEKKSNSSYLTTVPLSTLRQISSTKEVLAYSNLKRKSKLWRKLLLLLQSIVAFKRVHRYHIGWLHRSSQPWAKERHSRLEVIVFLQEEIEVLLRRNNEAKFGPSRWKALNIFKRYVTLIRSILAILTLLERQLQTMDNFPHLHHIYRAFFSWPSFRAELFAFSQSLCIAMSDLHQLVQCGAPDQNNTQHKLAAAKAMLSLASVIQLRDRFNAEYFLLRKRLYYGLHNDGHKKQRKTLAVHAPVLFNMNSVMFFLDTMVEQFVLFLSEEEVIAAEQHCMLTTQVGSSSNNNQTRQAQTVMMTAWQSVWHDLVPTQNQLLCFSFTTYSWRWTPLIQTRFLGSFKVALAMTIAALYGLLAKRPQPVLASFTIAYLAGGAVSGINIMTCINRGIGTVVACVFVVFIVIAAQQAASDVIRNVIVGFAVVLFQLPCTYIRSYPLYSYAGTVAGFTAALLLIDPKQPALVSIAINRIVDTIVGLFIYLLVELAAFAQPSESALLSAMEGVVKGIDRRFSNFHERLLRAASSSLSVMSSAASDVHVDDNDSSNSLEDMNALLRTQRDFFPFYKSEPRLFFSTPALPDRLLQEGLRWQEQAVLALQTMVWVVQSCDSVIAFHRESRVLALETHVSTHNSSISNKHANSDDGIELLDILEEGRRIRAMSMTTGAFPDFEAILLPLQGQYEEVETFVSQALAFLSLAIKELRHHHNDGSKGSQGSDPLAVLRQWNNVRQLQMLRALLLVPSPSLLAASQVVEDEGGRELLMAAPTSFAEEENRTVERLFASFQGIVDGLQSRIVEEGEPKETYDHDEEQRIASNREMKAVNALLSSTKDLLQALRGLAAVVSRMQAHRDLRITQDPMQGVGRSDHRLQNGKDHV